MVKKSICKIIIYLIYVSTSLDASSLHQLNLADLPTESAFTSSDISIEGLVITSQEPTYHPYGEFALHISSLETSSSWVIRSINTLSGWNNLQIDSWSETQEKMKSTSSTILTMQIELSPPLQTLFLKEIYNLILQEKQKSPRERIGITLLFRDALNHALSGDLVTLCDSEESFYYIETLRQHINISMSHHPLFLTFFNILLGQSTDKPLSCYESLQAPRKMVELLDSLSKTYQRQLQTAFSEPKLIIHTDMSIESPSLESSNDFLGWSIWIIPFTLLFILVVCKLSEKDMFNNLYKYFILPFYLIWGLLSSSLALIILISWLILDIPIFDNNLFILFFLPSDVLFCLYAVKTWNNSTYKFPISLYLGLHVLSIIVYTFILVTNYGYSNGESITLSLSLTYLILFYFEFILKSPKENDLVI